MPDNQDFFSLNNIDLDKAYEVTIGARGGGKLFFFEQLCIKQREELSRLQAENERLCAEIDELIIAKDLLFDEAEALIKKAKAEAYKEFAELGALAALQFGIDAIRQFIKTKTDLDPVFAFNPSEDELNKMGRYAFEMFENIAKELVGEDNV